MHPKYDIDALGTYLCCPDKFHHIHKVMNELTREELIVLRDELRSRTVQKRLNQFLELDFQNKIGKEETKHEEHRDLPKTKQPKRSKGLRTDDSQQ